MPDSRFSPGFRISIVDTAVLAAGLSGAAMTARHSTALAALVVLPVLHFFLFCNVFRISRMPELIWAASYIISSVVAFRTGHVVSGIFVGYNFLFAAVLIALEMRRSSYHGIFWRMVNPNLRSWWESRTD